MAKWAVMIGSKIIGTVSRKSSSAINKVLANYVKRRKNVKIGKISTKRSR